MSRRIALAGALACALLSAAPAANAADLGDRYAPGSAHDPYDDPRYADIYRHPPPPSSYPPPAPRYTPPSGYSYVPPPARHDDGYGRCVPSESIRVRLMNEGWSDFRGIRLRDDIAVLEARRPSGQLFRLKIDRCSGQILNALQVEPGAAPYAYGAPGYGPPGYATRPYAAAPYGRPGGWPGTRYYYRPF
ncbi:MAG TPA: hypothetical protein PK264_06380 [Hyphomicrobiaceae bacterium]|nr:hypothetical protein [Hyphomicrobiaceae bacterium]